MQDPESAARASLVRSLIIYALFLAADIAVIYYIVTSDPGGGAFITVSFVGVVGVLLAYQVYQHIRDLRSSLVESVGVIQRKWQRADLIIAWQSYYVTVERTVFRVTPEAFLELEEGMFVKIVHFPGTLNVISIHEVRRPPPDPSTQI